MRHLVATLLLLGLSVPAVARLRVCTLALNGPEEVETFRVYLGPDDFDFVDLTSALAPEPSDDGTAPIRCPAELRCDVVVISAEFGGRFFGSSARSVSLQDLEEASCQSACAGVFHAPQEVFLLACNTLATKDQDTRTPAEYLDVLRAHGFEESDAERVVAIRYGPLGQSFRETTRRVFAGVPRLYGFSTVAARGETTSVQLARYFTARPDYTHHLLTAWDDPGPNKALEAAFARTGMTQVSGLAPDDLGAGDHDLMCRLYDGDTPLVDRLRVVRDLMSREDALSFVPTVETFLSEHDPARFRAKERAVFAEVQATDGARADVLRLVQQLEVSALQIELAHLAERLGWMSREKLRVLAANDVRELLARRLTSELVDVTCAITQHEPVGTLFRSADLPSLLFERAEGLRLVTCLAPPDPAGTPACSPRSTIRTSRSARGRRTLSPAASRSTTRRSPLSRPGRTRTRRTYTRACAGYSARRRARSRRGTRVGRRHMNKYANKYALATMFLAGLVSGSARAADPDVAAIARITGLQPDVKNGVAKISVPRSGLAVTVDGVKMHPFQGFTSWAAFTGGGSQTIVMGDLTLAEDEVTPVMDAALNNGLEVTALHNHFSFDHPRILFMHIAGTGSSEGLAAGVRRALDAIEATRHGGPPREAFGGPTIPAENSIDPKRLEAVFGVAGQTNDGMVKFVFAKTTSAHGTELGAEMGVNTWAAFAGSPQAAVVDGDFAMLESELQPVLKALRAAKINVVAIHSHMTHEQPRIMFLHFWGKGPADDLARGIQAARAMQQR